MLSILVCHSYFLRFDQKQQQRAKPYPPLASLQVAAMLRAAGHEVSFFDAMLAEDLEFYERRLSVIKPQVVLFYEDNFNFLSKMCLGKMRDACFEMIRDARDAGMRIIAAGSDASDAPGAYLQAGADAGAAWRGVGRIERARLPPQRDAGHARTRISPRGCPTSVTRRNRAPSAPPPRRRCRSLRSRRCPPGISSTSRNTAASGGARMATSASTWPRHAAVHSAATGAPNPSGAINICSARPPTWPRRCCISSATTGPTTSGSPTTSSDSGSIGCASSAPRSRPRVAACPFTIQLRADLVSARMATALREAGCREVWIGAESGSQKILDAMNKGTRVRRDHRVARNCWRAEGLRVGFFLQLGYLGEELDDILATRRLLDEARPDDVGVSVVLSTAGHQVLRARQGAARHPSATGTRATISK